MLNHVAIEYSGQSSVSDLKLRLRFNLYILHLYIIIHQCTLVFSKQISNNCERQVRDYCRKAHIPLHVSYFIFPLSHPTTDHVSYCAVSNVFVFYFRVGVPDRRSWTWNTHHNSSYQCLYMLLWVSADITTH